MSAYWSIMASWSAVAFTVLTFASTPRVFAGQATDAGFFALLDGAPLVVTATVAERSLEPAPGIVTHDLIVQQVLKGTAPAPQPVVVEDLVFPSDRPTLVPGAEWLLALEPLPSSSRYGSLPAGTAYLRIRGGGRGVRAAQAAAAVQAYLTAATKPAPMRREARLDALVAALPSPVVGGDALSALDADPSLARDLGANQSQRLASALGNASLPLERRRALLDLIAAQRLAVLLPAVRAALADPPLAPFARRVLAAFGEAPSINELRADLEQPEPSASRSALDAAHALPAAERVAFLTGVAEDGRDSDLRFAAIDALARDRDAAVPVLAALLHDPDRRICAKAATALGAAGGDDALAALTGTFGNGTYEAQVAAVFALRDMGTQDAMRVLHDLRAAPPDPRLQKVIDRALGINTHRH